jgi:hypothetical protein
MSWRRGFWRLWLVLSLLWIVAVGVYAWKEEPWVMSSRMRTCMDAKEAQGANLLSCFEYTEIARLRQGPVGSADIAAAAKEYAAFALIPPLVVLGLGLLGAWVASGFARKGEGG